MAVIFRRRGRPANVSVQGSFATTVVRGTVYLIPLSRTTGRPTRTIRRDAVGFPDLEYAVFLVDNALSDE